MTRPASRSAAGSCPVRAPVSWRRTTSTWRPASRSPSCSPTHRIGRRPASMARADLAADDLVGLRGIATALGVADDDPVGEPDQHRRRDLARVRALELVMDVLGADPDVRIRLGEGVADRGERHERRADDPDHAVARGSARRSSGRGRRRRPGWCASSNSRPRSRHASRANHARAWWAGRVGGPASASVVARRSNRSRARWTAERWISRRSASSAEARLGRLAAGLGDQPDDVGLGRAAAHRRRACRSRRAAGPRR